MNSANLHQEFSKTALRHLLVSLKDGTHDSFQRTTEGVPLLSAKNVINGHLLIEDHESLISEEDFHAIHKSGYLKRGDVLLTIVGTIGRTAVFDVEQPVAFQRSVAVLRPGLKLHNKFLYYAIQSSEFQAALSSRAKQSAQSGVYLGDVGDTPLVYPELPLQKLIASFLDRKTTAIDTLVVKKQRLIQLLKEKCAALINQAVTKGLNPNTSMKDSGIPWIGKIPEHWKVLRLRHLISDKVAGPYGSSLTRSMYVSSGYRVYGQQQVIPDNFTVGDYYISPEKFSEMQRYVVQPEDVLVTVMGTIGRVAVVPEGIEPGIINPRLVKYVTRREYILPHFFAWIFRSKVGKAQLSEMAQGVTMDGLNLTVLSDLWMPVPPLDEQNNIVTHIHKITDRNKKLQNAVTKQIEKLQEYRQSLITAAVTGKLSIEEEDAA